MKLDLFSNGDRVLLVGEGNFSFSVCLLKHKLPISIIATCFENKVFYENQENNIEFLKSENVPIFYNVDATKLHNNQKFLNRHFSKVIFNFPHVGKKMKIQLNRELLKDFFKSVRHVVMENSLVMVSLCQGQGGTPFDKPQRKWNDSWQVTEMAAHGGFILTDVQPFCRENFKEYTCVGYRSQDVKFNLDGALVHIFAKRKIAFESLNANTASERMSLISLHNNAHTSMPVTYFEMYSNNPLKNPNSPLSFIKNLLVKDLSAGLLPIQKIKILTDAEIPLHVSNTAGVQFKDKSNQYKLRESVFDILNSVLQLCNFSANDELIFYPGFYFSANMGKFVVNKAPITCRFLIVGSKLLNIIKGHIENLVCTFKENNLIVFLRPGSTSCAVSNNLSTPYISSIMEVVCKCEKTMTTFVPAVVYSLSYEEKIIEVCIINADEICQKFFKTSSWKEIWAEGSEILINSGGKPILKQCLLFPSTYSFDITLRHDKHTSFDEEKMFELLWLAAGRLIEKVELVNEFNSSENWSSRCYKLTYKSFSEPVYRKQIINIQLNLIGPMLELGMNVCIG